MKTTHPIPGNADCATVLAFEIGKGSISEAAEQGSREKIKKGLIAFAKPRMEVIVYLAASGLALPNH